MGKHSFRGDDPTGFIPRQGRLPKDAPPPTNDRKPGPARGGGGGGCALAVLALGTAAVTTYGAWRGWM